MEKLCQLHVILKDVTDWNFQASPMEEVGRQVYHLKSCLDDYAYTDEIILGNFWEMTNLDGDDAVIGIEGYINKIARDIEDALEAAAANAIKAGGWRVIRSPFTSSLDDEILRSIAERIRQLLKFTDHDNFAEFTLQGAELGELFIILKDSIDRDLNPMSNSKDMMVELTQEVYMFNSFLPHRRALIGFRRLQTSGAYIHVGDYIWSIVRDLKGIINTYLDQLAKDGGCKGRLPKKGFPKIKSLTEQVRSLRQDKLTPLLTMVSHHGFRSLRQDKLTPFLTMVSHHGFRSPSLTFEETTSKLRKLLKLADPPLSVPHAPYREALRELQVIIHEVIDEGDLDHTSKNIMEILNEEVEQLEKLLKEEADTVMFRFGRISNLYYDGGEGDLEDHILKIVHDLKDIVNTYFFNAARGDGNGKLFTSFQKKVEVITQNKLKPLLEDTKFDHYPITPSNLSSCVIRPTEALEELKSLLKVAIGKDKNPTSKRTMEEVASELDKLMQLQLEDMPYTERMNTEHFIWNMVHDIQRIIDLYLVHHKGSNCEIFTRTSTTSSPDSKFRSLRRLVRYLRIHKTKFLIEDDSPTQEATLDEQLAQPILHRRGSYLRIHMLMRRPTQVPGRNEVKLEELGKAIREESRTPCSALLQLEKKVVQLKGSFMRASEGKRLRCDKANNDHINIERKTREVVHDIERIIKSALVLDKGGWTTNIFGNPNMISNFINQVNSIREDKLELLIKDADKFMELHFEYTYKFMKLQLSNTPEQGVGTTDEIKEPPEQQEVVIGFEEVTDTILNWLRQANIQYGYRLFINGLPGVGKTTLASAIVHHPKVREAFTVIWFAKPFTNSNHKLIRNLDRSKSYLIILDDISDEPWEYDHEIPSWFRTGYNKVLLTSSILLHGPASTDLITYITMHGPASADLTTYIRMHGMDQSRGWQLLHSQVYDKEDDDSCPELERIGKFIIKQCAGNPRAILLIADKLKRELPTSFEGNREKNTAESLRKWEEVAGKVDYYLFEPENRESMEDCMSTLYDTLNYSEKHCLLYMAMFPQDTKIPTWKLNSLLIAEGIQSFTDIDGGGIVQKLHSKGLLIINQGKDDISITSLNNVVYQFCRRKVLSTKQNMFHGIKRLTGGSPVQKTVDHNLALEKQKRSFPHCTNNKSIIIESITRALKIPRAIEANNVDFLKFQANPLHLRHITLSNDNLKVVPRTISMFRNMETLVVNTSSRTLEMEANLNELPRLKIFRTNAAIILRKDMIVRSGESLASLRYLSPQSCSHLVTNNIDKLRIRGELAKLLDSSFLEKAERITSLHLVNDVYPKLEAEKPLPRLPRSYLFPPNLESLALSSTYLDWEHMSTIARLHNLTKLKLKNYAFVGDHWHVTPPYSFNALKHLTIEGTNLNRWTTTSSHSSFGSLKALVLKNCDKLEGLEVVQYGNWVNLKLLKLNNVNLAAVSCAKVIEKNRKEWFHCLPAEMKRLLKPLKLEIVTKDGDMSKKDMLFSLYSNSKLPGKIEIPSVEIATGPSYARGGY